MHPSPSDCPIYGARGFSTPAGTGSIGVLIIGDCLDATDAEYGVPLSPKSLAGCVLDRAIRRSGFAREQFVLWNVVPVRPPNDWLEKAPYEMVAVNWGIPQLQKVINDYKPRCILALGNVALRATTGFAGPARDITSMRGYPIHSIFGDTPVVGSYHPRTLRQGYMSYLSVLMDDIKLAVTVASTVPEQTGKFYSTVLSRDRTWQHPPRLPNPYNPVVPPEYLLHPTDVQGEQFLRYMEKNPNVTLSYDIETPFSAVTDEDESDELGAVQILSIQFSPRPRSGIFLPWREPFIEIATRICALPNDKAGANTWRFDDPLLEAHNCPLNGTRHDIRWMWHHLQPDLRSSLQFISSFYATEMGPWKHLHSSHPEYYGIADVDVIQRILHG